jgi:hypothetical protein
MDANAEAQEEKVIKDLQKKMCDLLVLRLFVVFPPSPLQVEWAKGQLLQTQSGAGVFNRWRVT